MTANNPTSASIIAEAVRRSLNDPAYFLRFFLRAWFPSPLPPFHLGLLAISTGKVAFLDNYPEAHDFLLNHFNYQPDPADPDAPVTPVFQLDADGRMLMVEPDANMNWIIPRGFSKTTLVKGGEIYELLHDNKTFTVLVSATAGHSETQVLDIKTELETNTKLRAGYGDQVPSRADPEKWTAKELHLRNGAIIIARGRGGQIRGLTYQAKRPNRIVLDDIEDEESVATSNQRNKTSNWFYGSVLPAGQIMEGAIGQDWAQDELRIFNLGTLLGPECLVVSLSRDDTFSTIRFGARISPGVMLWEYKISEGLYERKRNQYKRNGKLAHFAKEYDSVIRVDEDAIFPAIFFYMPVARSALISVAQVMDPAISEESDADEAAIVVAGRHADSGALWFLDEWGDIGKSPSDLIEQFFKFHRDWQTNLNGIEAIAYQAALLHLAREEMMRRKVAFVITPIRHGNKQSKADRIIGTLSPRYKNNFIRHHRPLHKLESNLLDWPNGRKDFADAGAMAMNMLGETVGTVMEGGMEDLPAFQRQVLPATARQIGNYRLSGGTTRMTAARNPRYGG